AIHRVSSSGYESAIVAGELNVGFWLYRLGELFRNGITDFQFIDFALIGDEHGVRRVCPFEGAWSNVVSTTKSARTALPLWLEEHAILGVCAWLLVEQL